MIQELGRQLVIFEVIELIAQFREGFLYVKPVYRFFKVQNGNLIP